MTYLRFWRERRSIRTAPGGDSSVGGVMEVHQMRADRHCTRQRSTSYCCPTLYSEYLAITNKILGVSLLQYSRNAAFHIMFGYEMVERRVSSSLGISLSVVEIEVIVQ